MDEKKSRWRIAVPLVVVTTIMAAAFAWQYRIADDCLAIDAHANLMQRLQTRWAEQRIVVLLRHATKCDIDLPDCVDGNEVLTDHGREEAVTIGSGLRTLLSDDYEVRHSPLYRTRDTALLAFGESTDDMALAKPCKTTFQDYVKALPMATNQILVTHSSCINSLTTTDGGRVLGINTGKDPHFGIAAFFDRTDTGDELIGCMWPENWGVIAREIEQTRG
jgi:phosphohistidine phosphatase SixA